LHSIAEDENTGMLSERAAPHDALFSLLFFFGDAWQAQRVVWCVLQRLAEEEQDPYQKAHF
jgi:hypothetical protein